MRASQRKAPTGVAVLQGYLTILTSDSDLFIFFIFWKPIWKRSFIRDTVLGGSKGFHVCWSLHSQGERLCRSHTAFAIRSFPV